MIRSTSKGDFSKTFAFGARIAAREQFKVLEKYGPLGVAALEEMTPKETGETAGAWGYEIVDQPGYFAIHWINTQVEGGIHVAVLIQYGHATRSGTFVEGLDYINPAMAPIFEQMANDMWKVVTR